VYHIKVILIDSAKIAKKSYSKFSFYNWIPQLCKYFPQCIYRWNSKKL